MLYQSGGVEVNGIIALAREVGALEKASYRLKATKRVGGRSREGVVGQVAVSLAPNPASSDPPRDRLPPTPLRWHRVVLLGRDASADRVSRSDTIVVAKAGGGMVAVPRDTLVEIPGVGEDKINAAFATGEPDLTVETLENLTGLPMKNYVVMHFDGVQDIVNALGGITLEVEQPIEVGIEGRPVSIPAGTRTLDGFEVLAYVRYRDGPAVDIGRIGRQQRFVQELAREATSPERLPRLPATALAV